MANLNSELTVHVETIPSGLRTQYESTGGKLLLLIEQSATRASEQGDVKTIVLCAQAWCEMGAGRK